MLVPKFTMNTLKRAQENHSVKYQLQRLESFTWSQKDLVALISNDISVQVVLHGTSPPQKAFILTQAQAGVVKRYGLDHNTTFTAERQNSTGLARAH